MIAIVAIAGFFVAPLGLPKKAPKWMDYMLAGYAFSYDQRHGATAVVDPKTRYMLIRYPECDGGDLTLLLTKDRYEVDSMGIGIRGFSSDLTGKEMTLVEKALPSLSTGKGLAINMPVDSVIHKLGSPTKRFKTGSRKQFLNLLYHWVNGPPDEGTEYEQTYVFKEGRLIEVLFTWDPYHKEDAAQITPKAKEAVAKRKGN